jgi:L-rhamnose mutarotase
MEELKQIKDHSIKNHTILIDDRRLFGTADFLDISEDTIKAAILEINPNYQFSYENGFIENDILVATCV